MEQASVRWGIKVRGQFHRVPEFMPVKFGSSLLLPVLSRLGGCATGEGWLDLARPQSGQRPPGRVPKASTWRRSGPSGVIASTRQPGMGQSSFVRCSVGTATATPKPQCRAATIHAERGRTTDAVRSTQLQRLRMPSRSVRATLSAIRSGKEDGAPALAKPLLMSMAKPWTVDQAERTARSSSA